jgi:ribosomal protein L16 Arg81 hydroxylase
MSEQNTILTDLLGNFPIQRFFDDYYLKQPFARREEAAAFCSLGQWSAVEGMLMHKDADVIVGRGQERYSGSIPTTRCEADAVLQQGYTIGLRHADRIDPGLSEMAERFQSALRAPVDIHLYCTPAAQQGFGWHYDAEEVFVLQTEGSKTWSLRNNTVHPWPLIDSMPQNQRYEREITPVLQCTLNRGDWLYIPGGYWHSTSAVSQSISLSVGVNAFTALDYFDSIRAQLAQSILWRQRLPTFLQPSEQNATETPTAEHLRQFSDTLSQLTEHLATVMNTEYSLQTFLKQASELTSPSAETHATD